MGRVERDNQMLMRIASILLLLAGVAMRGSSASYPVRCRLFAILGQAEAITYYYALGVGVSALAPRVRVDGAIGPADLMSLAYRFCMLALLLRVAAWRIRPEEFLPGCDGLELRNDGQMVVGVRAGGVPACPDTS